MKKLLFLVAAGLFFASPLLAQKKFIDKSTMDTSVLPGDDFYHYVNGTWLKHNEIPGNQSSWGNFTIIQQETRKKLEQLVKDIAKQKNPEGSNAQKLQRFYNSGMDTNAIEKLGLKPILPDLQRIQSINSVQGIIDEVAFEYANNINFSSPLFSFGNVADPITNDKEILIITQGGMGLPEKSYYFDQDEKAKKLRKDYVHFLATLFELSGTPKDQSTQKAEEILSLETLMAKGSRTVTENRNIQKLLNYFTNEKLNKRFTALNFEGFFKNLNVHSDKIIVGQPEFLDTLNHLLTIIPLQTWKEYLTSRVLMNSASYLTSAFRKANFAFYGTAMSGTKEMKPRGESVINNIDNSLGEILGKLYIEKYFNQEAKTRIDQLVQNVIETFGERIKSNSWMTDSTKVKALEKLSTIRKKVAYPDKWRDYSGLQIGNNYYENVRAASAFNFKYTMSFVGKPVDRDLWGMTPPTLNAYYNPLNNEIVFPAGILLPPFFDPSADDAVNYGGIATVIGHEISHGFDDQGSQFDADGKFKNWWTKKDRDNFKERGELLANQFDQYEVMDSLHVNGKLTLGENIGDLCGVTVAYQAFKKTPQGQSTVLIDGLTPDQRFFISYATIWRLKQRDENVRTQVLTDPHSPSQFRINGPLSNLQAFYDAFGVKPGDKMWRDPKDRVEIW